MQVAVYSALTPGLVPPAGDESVKSLHLNHCTGVGF